MHNCVGELTDAVTEEDKYFFRWEGAERATVCVTKNNRGYWDLFECAGLGNRPVSADTRAEISKAVEEMSGPITVRIRT